MIDTSIPQIDTYYISASTFRISSSPYLRVSIEVCGFEEVTTVNSIKLNLPKSQNVSVIPYPIYSTYFSSNSTNCQVVSYDIVERETMLPMNDTYRELVYIN